MIDCLHSSCSFVWCGRSCSFRWARSRSCKLPAVSTCAQTNQQWCSGSNAWERPIGQVSQETLNVLDSLNTEYPPWVLDLIEMGNDPGYLGREFPRLDHLDHCTIVPAVWAQFEHKIHDESVDNWWHMKVLAGIIAACIWARISWIRKTRAE